MTAPARSRPPLLTIVLALGVTALDALLLALALGGATALLAHPQAIALLAGWAAGGVALALLRPVRSQDTVTIERDPALVLLLLFLLPLLTPPLAALGWRLGLLPLPGGEWLRWSGVAISIAGLGLRILAMVRLGARFSPLVAVQRQHALETHGLYAHVRHPGYLGSWLAAFGAVLAFGSAVGLIAVVGFGALLARRARHEDALLEQHFGDAYRRYRAHTGAFLPRVGWVSRDVRA